MCYVNKNTLTTKQFKVVFDTTLPVIVRLLGMPRRKLEGNIKMELSDLYSLPNIVRVVKSRRMRWAGHVARMGEGRGVHRVLVGET